MRIAALYDIHANLPALEAVLAEVERAGPDLIVIGGDFVAGPMPAQTLDRLQGLGDRVRFIRGNTERAVVGDGAESGLWAARAGWVAAQLTQEQRAFLAHLPETLLVDVKGLGSTLFCHGSPRNDEEIITRATPVSRILPMLEGVTANVVVCGHTHMQFDRVVGSVRLVNAGSVGMPYEGEPGAYWAVFGPEVSLRRTRYDIEAAAVQIAASGFPEAEQFARQNVLNPPSAGQAIQVFEEMAQQRARS